MAAEDQTIGERIAAEREALQMSQTLLAKLAEIDRDKLNKIEHGRRRVSQAEAARIARVLGLTPDDLAPANSTIYYRDLVNSPAAADAIALFERYIANWRILDRLRDFGAD